MTIQRLTIVTLWGKNHETLELAFAPLIDVGDGAEPSDIDNNATWLCFNYAPFYLILIYCNAALKAKIIDRYYIRVKTYRMTLQGKKWLSNVSLKEK